MKFEVNDSGRVVPLVSEKPSENTTTTPENETNPENSTTQKGNGVKK